MLSYLMLSYLMLSYLIIVPILVIVSSNENSTGCKENASN